MTVSFAVATTIAVAVAITVAVEFTTVMLAAGQIEPNKLCQNGLDQSSD
jgi:hypothetical protein